MPCYRANGWWWWSVLCWLMCGYVWKTRNKAAVKPIIVGLYVIRLSRILTLISSVFSCKTSLIRDVVCVCVCVFAHINSNRKPQTTSGWVSMIGQTCERVRYILPRVIRSGTSWANNKCTETGIRDDNCQEAHTTPNSYQIRAVEQMWHAQRFTISSGLWSRLVVFTFRSRTFLGLTNI